jgi:hypothetical protein
MRAAESTDHGTICRGTRCPCPANAGTLTHGVPPYGEVYRCKEARVQTHHVHSHVAVSVWMPAWICRRGVCSRSWPHSFAAPVLPTSQGRRSLSIAWSTRGVPDYFEKNYVDDVGDDGDQILTLDFLSQFEGRYVCVTIEELDGEPDFIDKDDNSFESDASPT